MSDPRLMGEPAAAEILIRADEIAPGNAREIEQRLRDLVHHGNRVIVVELPDLARPSASLAAVLLRIQRSLNWRNGRLIVVASDAARSTLVFMGLAESLDLVDADEPTVAAPEGRHCSHS